MLIRERSWFLWIRIIQPSPHIQNSGKNKHPTSPPSASCSFWSVLVNPTSQQSQFPSLYMAIHIHTHTHTFSGDCPQHSLQLEFRIRNFSRICKLNNWIYRFFSSKSTLQLYMTGSFSMLKARCTPARTDTTVKTHKLYFAASSFTAEKLVSPF